MTDSTVPVTVPCACPGTPHGDGDTVYLDRELGPGAGIAAVAVATADDAMTFPQRYGLMIETAIQMSVRDWTRQADTGTNGTGPRLEKVPISPETVRQQLTWDKGGAEVAVEAMKLYGDTLGVPFGRRKSSRPDSSSTPTGLTESSSTSPNRATRRKRPKPSA
jgi:hypothetical protein